MSSDPSESGGLLRDLEDELCRLPGVHAVRVVGDRSDRPVEVHVLSDQSKPAKQTVRDVRSVAHTVFGIELDHRIVSVAQLDTNDANAPVGIMLPTAERRARVAGVHVDNDGLRIEVRVTLVDGDRDYVGYAEGSIAAVARPFLVASSTLDALPQIEPAADAVHLAGAELSRVGSTRALVTVVYVEPPLSCSSRLGDRASRLRDDAAAVRCSMRRIDAWRAERGPRRWASRPICAILLRDRPVAVQLSFRLGGADGVAVEARKGVAPTRSVLGTMRRGRVRRRHPSDGAAPVPRHRASGGALPGAGSLAATAAPSSVVEPVLTLNPEASQLAARVAQHDGVAAFVTTTFLAARWALGTARHPARRPRPLRDDQPPVRDELRHRG